MSLGTRTLAQVSQMGGSKHLCGMIPAWPSEIGGNLMIQTSHCVKLGTRLERAHSCILQVRSTLVWVWTSHYCECISAMGHDFQLPDSFPLQEMPCPCKEDNSAIYEHNIR